MASFAPVWLCSSLSLSFSLSPSLPRSQLPQKAGLTFFFLLSGTAVECRERLCRTARPGRGHRSQPHQLARCQRSSRKPPANIPTQEGGALPVLPLTRSPYNPSIIDYIDRLLLFLALSRDDLRVTTLPAPPPTPPPCALTSFTLSVIKLCQN